jgi:dihydrofolate reductase
MHSLDSTIAYAEEHKQEEIFIIGGAEIYSHALSFADKLYLTRVADSPQGDAFFPEIHSKYWETVSRKSFTCNEKNEKDFEILEMHRIKRETGVVD